VLVEEKEKKRRRNQRRGCELKVTIAQRALN